MPRPQRAIDEIVAQGEGAPAHRDDSHFARFSAMRRELGELRAARPEFEPARPVVRNPMLGELGITHDRTRIVDPVAARAVDLANSIYALMVRALSQVFAPAPLPAELRSALAATTTALMAAMSRVADVATRLPADPSRSAATAAPTFELPGSSGPAGAAVRSAHPRRALRRTRGRGPPAGPHRPADRRRR